jgi:hypothetical protein
MLTGRKLALTLAFAVLVVVAFGMSCNGFFTDPVLQSIAIQPPSPQIEIGSTTTQTLQAWGTYDDNSRSPITSGVSWTSSPSTIVEITGACANAQPCGSATVQAVASGTATITAAAQGLSTTATATAYLGNINNFEVCEGTFTTPTSCSATVVTWNANNASKGIVTQTFIAQATNPTPPPPEIDLTTASTWTVSSSLASSITCDNSTTPATCQVAQSTADNTYPNAIIVTYGTSSSISITVVVTN